MSLSIEERLSALEREVKLLRQLRSATLSEIKAKTRRLWLQRFNEYDTQPDTVLSVSQLAEMCDCSAKTIRRLGVVKSCTADEFRGLLC